MKTLKKLFSVSAIVALLGTLVPMYAFGATYSDELKEAYAYAYTNGITTMKTIDNADMYGSLTRVAMAKMIANYATTVLWLTPDTSAKCTFTDVTAALDAQYDNWVTKACQLGLMGQNITAFRPNDLVTRAEFGTTLSRALNANSDDLAAMNAADPYYKDHLNFLKSEGIMNQIDNPFMTEVRGYVMLMMMRADEGYTPNEKCSLEEMVACALADDTDACLAACTGNEGEEENLPGYAKVSTKAAASQNVALNAVDKKIGTITLTAGENDTTVTNIEITKSGLWRATDIKNIQLMKNWEYVTNGGTISKNVAKLRFRPNLVLKAGKSETFDVVVSMAWAWAIPGGTHDFSVTSVTVSNGTFGWTPATLWSLTTTNYSIPEIDVDMANSSVNPGDKAVTISTVTLTPAQAAKINWFTLTLDSSDESLYNVISNAKAYVENQEVWNVTINDETLVVNGLNADVEKDDDLEVVIKADVVYVWNTTTFKLVMEANHVNAVETNNNESMPTVAAGMTKDNTVITMGTALWLTLKNKIKDTQSVVEWEKDVVLLDTEISSAADLDVTSYYIDFGGAVKNPPTPTQLDEVVLSVDGNETDINLATATFNGKKLEFKDRVADVFTVAAGDTVRVTLKAKIVAWTNETSYTPIFWIVTVKNLETNNTITPATPVTKPAHTTNVKWNWQLNVSKWSVSAWSTVKALEEKDVLAFNVKAKNEDMTVNSVKITLTPIGISSTNLYDAIDHIALYQGNTKLASLQWDDANVVDNGTTVVATFGTLSQTIKADDSETYTVKLELSKQSITTIWAQFNAKLAAGDLAAKWKISKVTVNNTNAIQWSDYQVVTAKSTIDVAQTGEYIVLTVNNNSEYDMIYNSFTVKVTSKTNSDNVELLPAWRVTSLDILADSVEWDVIATPAIISKSVNTLPWTLKVTWQSTKNPVITAWDSKTYVVRMNSNVEISENDYTATAKESTFYYFDWTTYVYNEWDAITAWTNATTMITETY